MIITVKNRKGKKLLCILDIPKKAKPLPAVLVVHGFSGDSTERHLAAISDSLVSTGFVTLRPDLTGSPGRSYLDFSDMTYKQELSDLEDISGYLLKMPEVDKSKIGIVGYSLGGMLAAELVAKRTEIKSLVLLSAVYDFRIMLDKVFKKPPSEFKRDFEIYGWTERWSLRMNRNLKIKRTFYEDIRLRTAENFASRIVCPALVISGDRDESVNQRHADSYLKNISSKIKKMEVIKGADHIYSGKTVDKVTKLVVNWFLKTLTFL